MADKSTVGVRLEADGEAEFKRSLKEIAQTGKTLSAEMKALESSFTDETSAQEKAEQRAELLNRQIQNQQNYVDQLSQKLDEARNSTDYNATATAKLEEQLYKAQAALNGMTSDLSATQAELAATGSEAENAGSWTEKVSDRYFLAYFRIDAASSGSGAYSSAHSRQIMCFSCQRYGSFISLPHSSQRFGESI